MAHFFYRVELTRPQRLANSHLLQGAVLGHVLPRQCIEAGVRGGDHQHQVRDRRRIAGRMGHGHHAAIAGAQADNGPQAQVLSQGFHVFDVLVERVEGFIAAGRSALSAVVKVNQLELFAQGLEGGFEIAVLAAGPAVDDQGGALVAHAGSIGHQPHAVNVKIDLGVA